MTAPPATRPRLGALPIMLGAVGLQVLGAVVMKLIADESAAGITAVVVIGFGTVMVINLARLVVWGSAHRRFPLSSTFPLSSLFFPAMLIVAWAFGDEITVRQIIGAGLITAGSVWLNWRVNT